MCLYGGVVVCDAVSCGCMVPHCCMPGGFTDVLAEQRYHSTRVCHVMALFYCNPVRPGSLPSDGEWFLPPVS